MKTLAVGKYCIRGEGITCIFTCQGDKFYTQPNSYIHTAINLLKCFLFHLHMYSLAVSDYLSKSLAVSGFQLLTFPNAHWSGCSGPTTSSHIWLKPDKMYL